MTRPARILVVEATGRHEPDGPGGPVLPVDPALLRALQTGDELRFVDARGRKRRLEIGQRDASGRFRGLSYRGAYIEDGTELRLLRAGKELTRGFAVGIPPIDSAVVLEVGDPLRITRPDLDGRCALRSADGSIEVPGSVPCTLPEVFTDVRPGERIWFDDGKIGGVVEAASPEGLDVRVTQARSGGARLRADKGINLPDSRLCLPAMTDRDLEDLDFAARHADLVGLSFVRAPGDVRVLCHELERRGCPHLGVVLKIETRAAFEDLPRILLAALRSPPVGVMVARGDLAVEMGFERLAEVQEEILWLCEAAHVPVIWATQVLETLARSGQPTRAEVTDAAMSVRAECVMLNKGPHVVDAVRFLDDVLRRMRDHQDKKRSMLRRLAVSDVEAAGV